MQRALSLYPFKGMLLKGVACIECVGAARDVSMPGFPGLAPATNSLLRSSPIVADQSRLPIRSGSAWGQAVAVGLGFDGPEAWFGLVVSLRVFATTPRMRVKHFQHRTVPAALTAAMAATPGGGGGLYGPVREYLGMPDKGGVKTDQQMAWDVLRAWMDKVRGQNCDAADLLMPPAASRMFACTARVMQMRQNDPTKPITKSDITDEYGKDWKKVKWDALTRATVSVSKKRKLVKEESNSHEKTQTQEQTQSQEQEVVMLEQTPLELLEQVCNRNGGIGCQNVGLLAKPIHMRRQCTHRLALPSIT